MFGRRITEKPLGTFASIPLDKILVEPQSRTHFDADSLTALAESMRANGLINPIRVRWSGERKQWILIAGERRFEAAKLLDWPQIDCSIADEGIDVLLAQAAENLQREDLRPTEKAAAFKSLIDQHGWSASQLAEALQVSAMTVSRYLAVLEMSNDLQIALDGGQVGLVEAIKRHKRTTRVDCSERPKARHSKRSGNAVRIAVGHGVYVTVSARRVLDNGAVVSALAEALAKLRIPAIAA